MKKKLILGIFVIGIVFCSLLIKTQAITVSFNIEDKRIESSTISMLTTSSTIVDLSLVTHEPIIIINDANFSDYGFPGSGTETHPYIIDGYNITTTDYYGIYVEYVTSFFIIKNSYFRAAICGIYLYNIYNIAKIVNNTFELNAQRGIYLQFTEDCLVENNTCLSNDHGISIDVSSGTVLKNNTCKFGYNGIFVDNSPNTIILENDCDYNLHHGIHIRGSYLSSMINNTLSNGEKDGLYVENSDNSIIKSNLVFNNSDLSIRFVDSDTCIIGNNTCRTSTKGLDLQNSYSCRITYNLLQENTEYGISSSFSSSNNIIHHNNFIDNNLGGTSQAFDDGTSNIW